MKLYAATAAMAMVGSASAVAVGSQVPLKATTSSAVSAPGSLMAGSRSTLTSKALQDSIKGAPLMARASEFYSIAKLSEKKHGHPTRVIGSPGHNATLEYIKSELAKQGDYYSVWTQDFEAFAGDVHSSYLIINHVKLNGTAMSLSPSTKDTKAVSGKIVPTSGTGCKAEDYPSQVKGSIAFIKRGECAFGTKSELAGRAGAIAAVVYNTEPGDLHGTLGVPTPHHIATLGLSQEEAQPILEQLGRGKWVSGIAMVNSTVELISTTNILAQTTEGDPDNCVMLGAHSDSVAEGPGINDDGSGSMSLLEIAKQLSSFSVRNCVRFAWWAGEEEGLLGSDYYVATLPKKENSKIRVFMDYDMLASPNFAYQVYDANNYANPAGSGELKELYIDWYNEHGLNYTMIPFDGRSDYDGFIRNGIPGGGIATGAEGIKTEAEVSMFGGSAGEWYDPCYHQLCDDVGNVNETAWVLNTQLVAHSVATYALSFDGFPERVLTSDAKILASEGYTPKFHGGKLAM
ncbi:Aminopeptidase Y [Ceratocystis pirilliformis]|uniref:Peptide hydrolase n=1 Tax=Ceratocystis pirilliformis TaxID=259994 RepID=A0ABR3YLK4_9PEZI